MPQAGSLLRTGAAGVNLDALKMTGNPTASGAAPAVPPGTATLRLVEQHGSGAVVRVESDLGPVRLLAKSDLLEEVCRPGDPAVLQGYEIATVTAEFDITPTPARRGVALAPDAEAAQPLYARYWLHNRGPAPLGGLPAVAHLHPHRTVATEGEVPLRLTVSSDRTDANLSGTIALVCPSGWSATQAEWEFDLEPGGYLEADAVVLPPSGAAPGLYPVRAQLRLTSAGIPAAWRQRVEDVCLITVGDPAAAVLRLLEAPADVVLDAGATAGLTVTVGTDAKADLALEAHLLSPWGTWEWLGPAARGAVLPAEGAVKLAFDVVPPPWTEPGEWWALIRVAAAGELLYTPAVRVVVR